MFSRFVKWMKPLPDAKNPVVGEIETAKQYKHWRIRMFFGIYLGYTTYYLTRRGLSSAIPSIMSEFGVTPFEVGAISSAGYLTYAIGKFFCGLIADKCNIRAFMAFGLIGASLINLFFGFLPSLPLLTFFWGVNNALQSMGFPPTAKTIVYWFSPSERATKWASLFSSQPIGTALSTVLASFCVGAGYWKAIFYIPGIFGLLVGIALLFVLTDKPSSVGLPPVEEFYREELPVKKQSRLTHRQILAKYVFYNPYLWILSIAYLFVFYVRFVTLDWGVTFLVARGIDHGHALFLCTCMPLVGATGGIVAGWIIDKFFKGRCVLINLIYLLLLIFSLIGMYKYTYAGASSLVMILFLSLVGFFVTGTHNLTGGVQITRITVQESVSAATGFSGTIGYIGSIFSGAGAGYLAEHYGWNAVFASLVISCVAAMLLISMTWKKDAGNPEGKI